MDDKEMMRAFDRQDRQNRHRSEKKSILTIGASLKENFLFISPARARMKS